MSTKAAIIALGLAVCSAASAACAQGSFPSRTVKFVLPLAAGSATDTVARILATKLANTWGQSVVVENMPGAGLNLGAAFVARSAPDGYTLLVSAPPPLTVNHLLYRSLQYQPDQFVPVAILVQVPNVLILRNGITATTVAELVASAKQTGGRLTYGSQGLGSTAHLSTRLLESKLGIEMVHVPYRGEVPALNDIVAGHIDVFFGTVSTAFPLYESRKLQFLGVASAQRSTAAPDVATLAEKGLPDFQSTAWYALVAPPGTPRTLVEAINRDVRAVMRDADVRSGLDKIMLTPVTGSPDDAAGFIAAETKLWTNVIKEANIELQ